MTLLVSANPTGLLHFYSAGFEKIASVIDGNKNYDDILGHRLERTEYASEAGADGLIPHLAASKICRKKILKHKPSIYHVPLESVVLGYGSTSNNKREFDFFEKWLNGHGHSINILNIAMMEKHKCGIDASPILKSLLVVLDRLFKKRGRVTKSILHQSISYTVSFVTALLSLRNCQAKLFVVANDHSPIPVAFAMVARFYGIKDVYVQHAEVTKNFPKLDYSFSVLRNKISKEIYKNIGKISGDVLYVERNTISISSDEIDKSVSLLAGSDHPTVVIYPSSICSRDGLCSLVEKLKKNSSVGSLKIKPHPASQNKDYFESLGIEVATSIPSIPHIAICGNTAVVIELLANGNLVYQYFDMDDIENDYYGFVKSSITNSLSLVDCAEVFWKAKKKNDSSEMTEKLGDYLPGIASQCNLLEREKQHYFVHKMMFVSGILKNFNVNVWHSYVFRRNFFFFTKNFLLECRRDKSADVMRSIVELNTIFNHRDPRLNNIYSMVDVDCCHSVVDFWLVTKKIEWTGFHPTIETLYKLMSYVEKVDVTPNVKKWMEAKLYDIMCRHAAPCQLDEYLNKCQKFSVKNADISKKISFMRYVKNSYQERSFLLKHMEGTGVGSDLELLKTEIQSYHPGIDGGLEVDYQKVEKKFLSSVDPNIAKQYLNYVIPVYKKLGERAKFIDVKFNCEQREKLLEVVEEKLKEKKGFSLIRLSDGEGYLFQEKFDIFTAEDAANRERHWWGRQIPSHIRTELIRETLVAIEHADVIGMPSIYRFLRDTNGRTKSLMHSIQGRGLVSVLQGIGKLDSGYAEYSDDKVNIAIFNKIEIIERLSNCANRVIVVSSGSEGAVKSTFRNIDKLHHIPVPTHHKTSLNENYISSPVPLPFLYKKICGKIRDYVGPGDLVLVGAGVAGKVFMHAAKSCNAVGIDVGSAMDEYVGGGIHSLH